MIETFGRTNLLSALDVCYAGGGNDDGDDGDARDGAPRHDGPPGTPTNVHGYVSLISCLCVSLCDSLSIRPSSPIWFPIGT